MSEERKELEARLMKAASAEEVTAILKDAGIEISAEEAEKTFEKAREIREADGREMSMEELDAVAGGAIDFRWYSKVGCAATVEPGSNCWGTDGGCTHIHVEYYDRPISVKCSNCGTYMYKQNLDWNITGNSWTGVLTCWRCGNHTYVEPNVFDAL